MVEDVQTYVHVLHVYNLGGGGEGIGGIGTLYSVVGVPYHAMLWGARCRTRGS